MTSTMDYSTTTTLGLIGCGIWGRVILRDLKDLGHRVWVVEPDTTARLEIAGIADKVVSDVSTLPGVSGLVVATPASTHFAVVSSLLSREVPILCEKPLTTDIEEARALVARAGGRLFVGHVWCYHPGVEELAKIARTAELGPVLALRSTRTNWASPRRDVDSVWNLAPHDLSLAQYILGSIPEPRYAHAEIVHGRCVGMIGILGSTPSAIFEVSNRFREKRREIRLHCREGVAVLGDPDSGQIEITRGGPGGKPELELRAVDREPALLRELRAFCAFLNGGVAPRASAADGLAVVEALEALRGLAGLPAANGTS